MTEKESSDPQTSTDKDTQQPDIPKYSEGTSSNENSTTPSQTSKDEMKEDPDSSLEDDEIASEEKEKIEEEIKNIAREYERQEAEKPKSMFQQLLITFSFIFGPVLFFIVSVFDGFFPSLQVVLRYASLIVIGLLVLWVLFESYRKSKR